MFLFVGNYKLSEIAFSINIFVTDKCDGLNCLNDGTCEIEKGKAVCKCPDRYSGQACEIGNYHRINIVYRFSLDQ